ncbi:MAG: hemolysin III family protein [Campylobacterales bacterium]|nr:hemolysin III family protein [Campylobacterales bacterium]
MSHHIKKYSLAEEISHAVTHGVGLLLSIAGLAILIGFAAVHSSVLAVTCSAIFGATLIILYGASTLYHAITHEKIKNIFQQFDHASIYLLIAGTYTPITLIALGGTWGWTIFSIIWGSALLGITLELTFPGRFKKIAITLYLLMGWMIIVAINPLINNMENGGLWLLLAGGLSYSVGVIFYLWRSLPFNHTIWHLFVLGGSVTHYLMVLIYII